MSVEFSRRNFLCQASMGFGLTAFSGLMASPIIAFPARAKQVIFCYMSGGVSHVDSFDPKPKLNALHGRPMPVDLIRTQFNQNGPVMASPFTFKRYGESGMPVSSLFPEVAQCVDKIAIIRSMTSSVSEHAQANLFMHSGFPFMGHPSAGAWISYGLGAETSDLPGYVVLQSGHASPPHGGVAVYSNGYLPGNHQASILNLGQDDTFSNTRSAMDSSHQIRQSDFIRKLDQRFVVGQQNTSGVEAAIQNYEKALRMQIAIPELYDLSGESKSTRRLYGLDASDPEKAAYAHQCLLARRLVERGVRFVELSCLSKNIGAGGAANPWDQHGKLKQGHEAMAHQVDQPIAGLLRDLEARGMLEETLVIWAGEFGRTPFSQGKDGRDHNPLGFSIWLAGGGVKGGTIYGSTDELGYRAVDNPCTVYDLWATVLHLLGLDHKALTYRFGGRDLRLTDVHGDVLHPILA